MRALIPGFYRVASNDYGADCNPIGTTKGERKQGTAAWGG
jgi:hypothetical protein